MTAIVADVSVYAFLCVILTLTGAAILHLLRLPMSRGERLLLGPAVTQACWACVLTALVRSGCPLRSAVLPVSGITLALAAYGLFALERKPGAAGDRVSAPAYTAWLLGLSAVLPAVAMLPYLGSGLRDYRGSGLPDGWSYIACAQYLWSFARGTEGGLAPLYQYGSIFSFMRNVSASQLGLLSIVILPGQADAAAGVFQAASLFTFLASCAAFACTRRLAFAGTVLYLIVVGASGWIANLVWASNYDHGLALAYAPALAVLLRRRAGKPAASAVATGLLLAAVTLTYPELALLVIASACLAGPERLKLKPSREALRYAAFAVLVWLLLAGPSLWELGSFFANQLTNAAGSDARPGEGMFTGLVSGRDRLAALWALGAEHGIAAAATVRWLAAAALTGLLTAGVAEWARRRDAGTIAALGWLLTLTSVLLVVQSYSYGAYKAILTAWWLIALAVVTGWEWCVSIGRGRTLMLAGATAICLAIPGSTLVRGVLIAIQRPVPAMPHFRTVQHIVPLLDGQPVAVLVDDVDANYWAVYFLRDTPIRLYRFGGYFAAPHIRQALERAEAPPRERIRFMLTDASHAGFAGASVVWQSGAYRLWKTGSSGWTDAGSTLTSQDLRD